MFLRQVKREKEEFNETVLTMRERKKELITQLKDISDKEGREAVGLIWSNIN